MVEEEKKRLLPELASLNAAKGGIKSTKAEGEIESKKTSLNDMFSQVDNISGMFLGVSKENPLSKKEKKDRKFSAYRSLKR